MDKHEFNIKIEQMKRRAAEGDFGTAMKIADTIDWTRVRNTSLLDLAAEVYEKNGEIQEAKDKLLLAFERAPIGKRLLYKLTELSVKSGDLEEAEDYYHEFADLAPDDTRCLLLAYMIMKAKNAAPEELVDVLERYTAADPDERWLYELAKAYDAAGRGADCVRVCDKVKLLYGTGAYADKAMRLKQKYSAQQGQRAAAGGYAYAQNTAGAPAYTAGYAYGEPYTAGGFSGQAVQSVQDTGAGLYSADSQLNYKAAQDDGAGYAADVSGDMDSAAARSEAVQAYDPYSGAQYGYPDETNGYGFSRAEAEDRMGDILANQRYENEDAAFEAYLQLHRMDDPAFDLEEQKRREEEAKQAAEEKAAAARTAALREETADTQRTGRRNLERKAGPVEVMPEHAVGYEEDELQSDFADKLSAEVSRIRQEDSKKAAGGRETETPEDELGKTRILDENRIERLRKIVIRDDSFASAPQIIARDEEAAKQNAVRQAAALTARLGANNAEKQAAFRTGADKAKESSSEEAEQRAAAETENKAENSALKAAPEAEVAQAVVLPQQADSTAMIGAAAAAGAAAGLGAAAAVMAAQKKSDTDVQKEAEPQMPEQGAVSAHETPEAEKKASQAAGSGSTEALAERSAIAPEEVTERTAARETEIPAAKPQLEEPEKPLTSEKAAQAGADSEASPSEQRRFHMIIEAGSAEEGLSIAIDELKYIHKEHGIQHSAVKTTAEKLNQRGISPAALAKISGKDFLVEHAGSLNEQAAAQIYDLIRTDRTGMIVVLIDVPEGLDRLEAVKPEIFRYCDLVSDFEEEYEEPASASFGAEQAAEEPRREENAYEEETDNGAVAADKEEATAEDSRAYEVRGDVRPAGKTHASSKKSGQDPKQNNLRVKVPQNYHEEMELDDFAQYCCKFASEIDCSITGKSMLALYERIELMEEDNIPLTRETAENLIEEAADRAEKPPLGKRLKGMFHSKYDKNGLLILKEEDFIY